ncbi:MAG TPA: helix-turn-helix transcriptional regulator, partial [Sphingobacteriaceae bacterium]
VRHGLLDEVTNLIYMGFAAAALLVFYQRRKRLYGYFSNPSRVRLGWLEQFLLVALGVITLSVASFYSKAYGLPNFPEVYPYHLVLLVIMVYWIGFELVADPTVFTADEPEDGQGRWDTDDEVHDDEAPRAPLADVAGAADPFPPQVEERKILADQLRQYMDEFKPYLNANLTLNDLSSELQITRQQLSRVISQEFNVSFFEFINGYRIREFRREVDLGLNRHLSLLGIALNCGFTSSRNFNRTFRQFEGITPASYIAARTSGQA